jgi:D-beta-D-heptose 7-phosphate kinase/D-beta-D-heptose 1-phosphate adenosyltransferase
LTLSLPDFSHTKILVAGDLMLDRYWTGSTNRISPEAPVPVIRVSDSDDRLGGAANVALNLAGLGCEVNLHGITGQDEAANQLESLALEAGLNCFFDKAKDKPTITKLRIISRHQQLIRMDFEDSYSALDKSSFLSSFESSLAGCSAVVLSDYGKGSLSECQAMIQAARKKNIPILVDPKGTEFEKYRGATLATPNLSEFEQFAGTSNSDEELLSNGEKIRAELDWNALLITLGERGVALIEAGQEPLLVPTQAKDVFDVTGAGDTVIGTLAACIGAGTDLAMATRIANLAAGIVVGKLGTATASPKELQLSLGLEHKPQTGILKETELLHTIELCRSRDETIVMTNGCFDLLHTGHVRYLQKAASLGDHLLIAVNTDSSVKQLKGPTRPLNKTQDRMEVLAALGCVTWVTEFTEEAPQRLIGEVLPDILVKGGDYKAEEIAGYTEVIDAGGRVEIITFESGYSTTAILDKAKNKLE